MIKFGPSGNDKLFYEQGYKDTLQMAKWLQGMGLNAYEYSFGRGIRLSYEKAKLYGDEFKKHEVVVSVHAPYYINFANPDDAMAEKSYNYVIESCKMVKLFGGNRVVVHTGTNGKLSRVDALNLCKERLKVLAQKLVQEKLEDCLICLETMGKYSQIGDYNEIIDLCTISNMYIPTFDFGHLNCLMQGSLKQSEDFCKIFQLAIDKLGFDKIKNVHIHFSKIQYGIKGEIKHLTLEDEKYGPEFQPLAIAIHKLNLKPTIICESSEIMAQDALKLKKIYSNLIA